MPPRMLKLSLLFTLLILIILVMAGCACKHETTAVIKAADASCVAEGYTGDTVCTECDEVVTAGEVIPALGHTEGELTGAAEASCTEDGYTGDIPCTVCAEILTAGEAIPAPGHTEGELTGAAEASCTEDGYTGDIPCTVCGEILTAGEAIPAAGHTPEGEQVVIAPTCTEDGVKEDVLCAVCGEVVTAGEAIPAPGHTAGEPEGAYEPTCTEEGYTGDCFCTVCGEIVASGEFIPVTEHVAAAEPAYAEEPTCRAEGYTGDIVCEYCGEIITAGEAIPALAEHTFENSVCTGCGWMEPGLYADGAMVKTWEELKADGMATVENGILIGLEGDFLMGTLVVGEDVTYIDGADYAGLKCDTLTAVYLPETVTGLGKYLLAGNKTIAEVRIYGDIAEIPDYAFVRAYGLKTIYLPGSLEAISEKAFRSCDVVTVYFGGTAEQWEAIGGSEIFPEAEVIFE